VTQSIGSGDNMIRSKSTMGDLSALTGLDRSTVSRILRGDFRAHRYNPETVARVRGEAVRLEVRPNHAARSLRTGRSHFVGVLVARIRNPWFGELAAELDGALSARGCRVILADSNEEFDRERASLQELIGFGVDGIILAPCALRRQPALANVRTPLVVLDYPLYPERPCVRLDATAAARDLLALSRTRGYRRVGLVCHQATADLERAFLAASTKVAVIRSPAALRTLERVPEQVLSLLDRKADCLIGLNNDLTIGLLACLRERGVRVRKGIGVAGIDDFPAAALLDPALTVLRQPVPDYAKTAVRLLMEQIEQPDRKPQDVRCRGELVVRASM
jgi:DNA-binding LacI/PurR family transcriptional regulator